MSLHTVMAALHSAVDAYAFSAMILGFASYKESDALPPTLLLRLDALIRAPAGTSLRPLLEQDPAVLPHGTRF